MKQIYVLFADDGTVSVSTPPPTGYVGPFAVPDDFEQTQFLYRLGEDGALVLDEVKAEAHRIEALEIELRDRRNASLNATGYYLEVDYPITPEKRAELLVYRQALRDITAQDGWPDDVVWPEIEM